MQFDLWTFALQVINFLILAWLLQRFLYKPVRKIIEERRALVDAKLAEAEKSKKAAEEEKARLEAANAEFAAEREKRLAELHKELAADKEKALADARIKARELIDQGRLQLENERAEALKALRTQVAQLASDMAAKIMSERPSEPEAIFGQFRQYVAQLPDEEKRKLHLRLSEQDDGVCVATAAPLTPGMQEKWREQIAETIGSESKVAFETDASLIGGAEVRFPHAIIKLSVSDALARLKESVSIK